MSEPILKAARASQCDKNFHKFPGRLRRRGTMRDVEIINSGGVTHLCSIVRAVSPRRTVFDLYGCLGAVVSGAKM